MSTRVQTPKRGHNRQGVGQAGRTIGGVSGNRSTLAEKLDRLAARLQQISTAPDHGAPLRNPHGVDDGYEHDDIDHDDRGSCQQTVHHDDLNDYAEALDSGRVHDARGGWDDRSESSVVRSCCAMTPPPASEHPEPRRGPMPEPQAQQAETDRDRVLDAIVKTLDSLDARIRDTEARMEENLRSEQAQHELDRMEQANRERETRERQTEIDLYNARAVQRERRQGSRRNIDRVPTAREIGHAVADMGSDAAALAPRAKPSDPAHPRPVFARVEGGRPAPSSDHIPRRRPFDWNPKAKTDRRIDDQTFQEIRAELTAMRANMGAPGPRAPEPSDDLPTRIEPDAFEPRVDQGWQSPAQRSEAERSQIDAEAFERLARRIDRSLEEFDLPALYDLRSELAEIHAAVNDGSASASPRSLQAGYSEILDRLDALRRKSDDPRLARRLEARVNDMARAIEAIPQIQHLSVLERRLTSLNSRFDSIASMLDPQGHAAVEAKLDRRSSEMTQLDASLNQLTQELPHISIIARSVQILNHKMNDFTNRLTSMAPRNLGSIEDRLARLENNARFIGEAVTQNTTEARLSQMGDMLHEAVTESTSNPQGLMAAYPNSPQQGRLEEIQNTLNQMVITLGIEPHQDMIDRLEVQIGKLGNRMEELTNIDTLTRMEAAIRKLSNTLESGIHFKKLVQVEHRLIEIERHLASLSSDAVELARSAARDAVREVALEMAAQQDSATDLDPALAELHDQIDALKAAEARDRGLHQKALVAISDSVGQILARLDRLEETKRQLSERLLPEGLASSTALSPAPTPSCEADWDPMPRHESSMSLLNVGQCSDRPKPDEGDDYTPAVPGSTGFLGTSDHDDQDHLPSAHPEAFDDRVQEEFPQSQAEYGFGGDETPPERPAPRQSQTVGQPDRSMPPAIEHDLEADVSSAPKRELLSNPRARLFGNPADQPALKRGLLRSREKKVVENDSQSINAATMHAATADTRAHIETRQPLVFDTPETGSDHEKFSLDHNPRPNWNTLSDEFQPLQPGARRPDMGPEENTDADFNPHGQLDFDRSDMGKQHGFGEQQIADSNASLLSRVGRVIDKKSDSIAVVAGAMWKRQRCCPTTPQPDSQQPHRMRSPR